MFRATLPVTLAAALFAFGCGGTTASTDTDTKADAMPAIADDSSVVARSGETTVTKNEFDAEMLAIPKRARERYNTDRGRKSIIERMLLNKVMLAEAKARGITADPLVQLAAQAAANKAYVAAFTNSLQDNSTDDAAVQAYYEENQQRYAREMVKAKHILVKEAATAAEVKSKLDAGGDFAALATEYSTDPGSKRRGGDLGWFTKERMVKPFSDAAFKMEIGAISNPIESKFGFHVIQLDEKRSQQPLEEVRAGIERLLGSNSVKEYTDGVRKDLSVELVGEFAPAEGAETDATAKPSAVTKPRAPGAKDEPAKAADEPAKAADEPAKTDDEPAKTEDQ
jgi:peptidyl-prolyl cis-trans isomerase C